MKNLSLALILLLTLSAVGLTGCSEPEDDGSNVVSVLPPKDAPLQPVPMGGGGSARVKKDKDSTKGSGQLPPP